MKSLSGSIITLGGAIIMAFNESIPKSALITLTCIGLIIAGLLIIKTDNNKS